MLVILSRITFRTVLVGAVLAAALALALSATPAIAQWPTSCVELNDIVEAHLDNHANVGIYQRVFGAQAEQACQNDHRADVQAVFAWAIGGQGAAIAPEPLAWPTTCVALNDIVEGHLGNSGNVGIYQRVFDAQAETACRNDHRADVQAVFVWALLTPTTTLPSPTFTLFGTVRDSRRQGSLIIAAVVRAEYANQVSVTTATDGRFRIENLHGTVKLTVSAEPHFKSKSTQLTMHRDRTADVALDHSGTIPFLGTVYISPRIITPRDPTSLGTITYNGRGQREVFDWRIDDWHDLDVHLFDVNYAGRTVEFQVNPEFGSSGEARSQVDKYAPAIGRIPHLLLEHVGSVTIHAGDEAWGGSGRNILIHADNGVPVEFYEEAFLLEGTYASLNDDHLPTLGWQEAQRADRTSISEYARDNQDTHDVAESFLAWFAVRHRPDRLTASELLAILDTIPNRLAYFDAQNFDVFPYAAPQPPSLPPVERPLPIRGRVTGPNGKGLEAILLWAWTGQETNSHSATTRADGTFTIGTYPGSFTLEVYAGPGCSFVGWYDGSGGITTEPSQAFTVTIDGASITGIQIRLPAQPDDLPRIEWCAP